MKSTTIIRPTAFNQTNRSARMTWAGSVKAESIRFWSLTSNRWALLATAITTGFLAAMEAAFWSEGEPVIPDVGHTYMALSGLIITQLIVAVMGALSMTSEYGNGSIVTSTLAVPKRTWILSAKAVVLAMAVFPVTLIGGVASFLVTGQLLDTSVQDLQSITDSGVLTSILGSAAYLTAVTLIGLGIGALIRSTAGAVAIVTGALAFLPELVRMILPNSVYDTVGKYLPTSAGESLWSPVDHGDLLSTPVAAIVLTGWALAILISGAITMTQRDT